MCIRDRVEIKAVINEWYNRQITDTIESGYVWNGLKVWLSMENQICLLYTSRCV